MISEDDEFENYEVEEDGALERIIAALREEKDATPTFDLTLERQRSEDRGVAAPMPEGWASTPVDLGRPAWKLSGPEAKTSRTILHFFGGGYCIGTLASRCGLAAQIAKAGEAQSYLLEYRLGPEHPFPAAFDDGYLAYRRLLLMGHSAESIVLVGELAGGGLALAVAAQARAAGLPMPLAIVAIAPWADLAQSGDSIVSRAERDPSMTKTRLDAFAEYYLAGADPRDPRASPLFADLTGLPQTLVHVGGEEILLSDAERLIETARAAGVDATVEIWPGLFHVWHRFYEEMEEAREGISEIGAWLKRRWKT